MEPFQIPRATVPYVTRLDRTLKALQDIVKEQESTLKQLRTANSSIGNRPSTDDRSHLQQIRSLNATYESVISQDPYLPSPGSPLPALLAFRSTQDCIDETEKTITKTQLDLQETQMLYDEERSYLNDANLVRSGMEARILSLHGEIEKRSQQTPGQVAKELLRDMENEKTRYDGETRKLVKAFNGFIDEYLAPMLAAEELGGPIVGEALNIDEAMLEGGFNSQGRAKRNKTGVNEDKRQRRIDEIWGPRPAEIEDTEETWNETRAAAAEMRDLTEQLLNRLVEATGGGSGVYVELERESAAARFLVRSKVAQFHPRDARRLRLIDFGAELEE